MKKDDWHPDDEEAAKFWAPVTGKTRTWPVATANGNRNLRTDTPFMSMCETVKATNKLHERQFNSLSLASSARASELSIGRLPHCFHSQTLCAIHVFQAVFDASQTRLIVLVAVVGHRVRAPFCLRAGLRASFFLRAPL